MIQTLISFIALATSIVALVLNRKVSFKKTVKDKQLELVYELIAVLSNNEIDFMYRKDNVSGITGMSLYQLTCMNFKEKESDLFSKNLFFQSDSSDSFKFLKLMGNPFLPQEIFTVMEKFYFKNLKLYSYDDIAEMDNYVAIITLKQKTNELNYYCSDQVDHLTFEKFHNLVIELYTSVNNWLDKYEAGDLKFRMDRKLN